MLQSPPLALLGHAPAWRPDGHSHEDDVLDMLDMWQDTPAAYTKAWPAATLSAAPAAVLQPAVTPSAPYQHPLEQPQQPQRQPHASAHYHLIPSLPPAAGAGPAAAAKPLMPLQGEMELPQHAAHPSSSRGGGLGSAAAPLSLPQPPQPPAALPSAPGSAPLHVPQPPQPAQLPPKQSKRGAHRTAQGKFSKQPDDAQQRSTGSKAAPSRRPRTAAPPAPPAAAVAAFPRAPAPPPPVPLPPPSRAASSGAGARPGASGAGEGPSDTPGATTGGQRRGLRPSNHNHRAYGAEQSSDEDDDVAPPPRGGGRGGGGGGGGGGKKGGAKKDPMQRQGLKLVTHTDLRHDLTGRNLKLLWPDDNVWWDGNVTSMDMDSLEAVIFYSGTGEEEEASLAEMVEKKELAWPPGESLRSTGKASKSKGTPKGKKRAAADDEDGGGGSANGSGKKRAAPGKKGKKASPPATGPVGTTQRQQQMFLAQQQAQQAQYAGYRAPAAGAAAAAGGASGLASQAIAALMGGQQEGDAAGRARIMQQQQAAQAQQLALQAQQGRGVQAQQQQQQAQQQQQQGNGVQSMLAYGPALVGKRVLVYRYPQFHASPGWVYATVTAVGNNLLSVVYGPDAPVEHLSPANPGVVVRPGWPS